MRVKVSLLLSTLVLAIQPVLPSASFCWVGIAPPQAQTTATKTAGPSNSSDPAHRLVAIEKMVEEKRNELGVPGMAVVIVMGGEVIYTRGFGLRDVEHNKSVTPDTLFRIGSDTKAFTAMATVMSQDDGKLSLEDSPKKYLPYFKLQDPEANLKVTVRDLLCHRAGLGRTDNIEFTGMLTRAEVIRVIGMAKPIARFREKFTYNNAMFAVAGEVVAKAQHSTWDKVITDQIFLPLGMDSSNLSLSEMLRSPDFAYGYQYLPETKETKRMPPAKLEAVAPAGAINSNARDMAQWLRFMLARGVWNGKRLVSEAGYNELITEQIKISSSVGYGLGWYLVDWKGHKVVVHAGNTAGYSAEVALMPDHGVGVVTLTNQDDSSITKAVRDSVWSNLVDDPPGVASTAQNQGSRNVVKSELDGSADAGVLLPSQKGLLGSYQSAFATSHNEIAVKDDRLVYINSQKQAYPMIESGKDSFRLLGLDGVSLEIKRDLNGKVSGIVVKQSSGSVELDRLGAFISKITVDELMSKLIAATGGEANIRNHKSMRQKVAIDFETLGINGEGVIIAKAPNLWAVRTTRYALGKRIGASFSYFDGKNGGGDGYKLSGSDLDDERIDDEFYGLLDWRTLFKKVEIKSKRQVGNEEAYLVVAAPEHGSPVAYYISSKSFLLLKRERRGADTSLFEDYRKVAGEMSPFKITYITPGGQRNVYRVKEIKFDVDVPDAEFSPQ